MGFRDFKKRGSEEMWFVVHNIYIMVDVNGCGEMKRDKEILSFQCVI